MVESESVSEAKGVLVGRLFTLGGSALFLIGSFIAAVYAAKDVQKAETNR